MTNWNARALRLAAIAMATLIAGVVLIPDDSLAFTSGTQKPRQASQFRRDDSNSPKPRDRLIFNYNYFSAVVEGGGTFGSYSGALSGTFGPAPPGGTASFEKTFIGGDFQVPLGAFFGPQAPLRLPFTPIIGASGRGFVGGGDGTIPFHIHPTPFPSTLTFARDSSATFYGGVRIHVGDLTGNGTNVVLTPRVGVNVENGKLTFTTNEAGPITVLTRSRTATGFHGGLDADFFLPNTNPTFRPFVGVGVAIDTVPDISLNGRSARFDYRANTDTDVNVTVKGRIGVAFSPN